MNKLQWNVYRNSYIFIQENPFENVVWKMVAILSRPQCVKTDIHVVLGFQDTVYWSDWLTKSIFKANKFNGNNVSSVAVDLVSPMDLQIYHPYRQPNAVNRCIRTSRRCSHLCLLAPYHGDESFMYTCTCPSGRKLLHDGHTCVPEGKSWSFWLAGWF